MRIVLAFVIVLLGFDPARAADVPLPAGAPLIVAHELIPAHVASFSTSEELRIDLGMPDTPMPSEGPANATALLQSPAGETSGKRKYLPVLYSLILPGAGEIATGHYYRGAALLAAEAAAWTGYAVYRDRGLDGRREFESFADAHWDRDRWIQNHPAAENCPQKTFECVDSVGQNDWTGWPGYHSYAAKEDEKQNYYENIGKYDWFISGWEDWDPAVKPMNTALRDTYRAMRKESNDDLDTADRFIYLSIAARLFSVVEMLFLVRDDGNGGAGASEDKKFRLTARSTGLYSGEVAFEVRFR